MPRRTASLSAHPARPSEKKDHLVEVAEDLFDRFGFHGTGVDRVIQDSGVARMTLYKHFPTKNALVLAVIERRDRRFREFMAEEIERRSAEGADRLLAIFEALGFWLARRSSHGCLLLRAMGEFSNHDITVSGDAAFRKRQLVEWMNAQVAARFPEASEKEVQALGLQLALVFEGAVALAPVIGAEEAALQARSAAERLTGLKSAS